MSDSNRVLLGYLLESTFGVTPAAAFTELRFTGESLSQTTATTTSQEIRSDRMIADVIRTSVEAGGDVNAELSYGAHDDLYQAVLGGTWSADLAISNSGATLGYQITAASRTLSDLDLGGPFAAIVVGQWIKLAGWTNPTNNGYFRVETVTDSDNIILEDPGAVLVDETELAGNIVITGSRLVNGIVERSFSLEKQFLDIVEFVPFVGMRVGTWSLTVSNGAISTQSFGFSGKSADAVGATTGIPPVIAAPTNPVMNGIDNATDIREGGVVSTFCVSEISFQVENNLRMINCVGEVGPTDIGIGSFGLTGSLNVYFDSRALYEKYLDFTTSSLSFRTIDALGNAYIFTIPALKFTAGEVVAGGLDQDVMANMQFTAFKDAVSGVMLEVDRFAA